MYIYDKPTFISHPLLKLKKENITFKAKQIAREKYVCYPSCSEQKLQFVG